MLPVWLEGPVRAVLHDLQQPAEVRVKVRYREDPVTDERVLVLPERPGGFTAGLSLGGHPHPAVPVIGEDGQAWWVCPSEQRPIAPIGQLYADAS
jgi:hypothetical protein